MPLHSILLWGPSGALPKTAPGDGDYGTGTLLLVPLRTLVMPLSDETQMACCDFVSFMPVITACSNLASVLVYSYLCTLIANILSSFTALITLVVFSCQ